MSTVSKYWDKYRERHRAESVEKPDVSKIMTDKQAYISFLEVQLERVTQTVLTTQGFSDRIESLQTQVNSSEEKIINLTRLVKLQQTYAESQEEEINQLKKVGAFEPRPASHNIASIEKKVQNLEEKLQYSRDFRAEDIVKEVEGALKSTELKITGLLSKVSEDLESKQKKHQKNIEASLEQCSVEFSENYKDLSKKIAAFKEDSEVEVKVKRLGMKVSELEAKVTGKPRASFSDDFEKDLPTAERLETCEKGLKDLEHFLVAIAEEVKKLEEKHLDTSDIECRISEKLNAKVEKLSALVKRTLKGPAKSTSPERREELSHTKESPKFPNAFVSHSKSDEEDRKPRSKSKESDCSRDQASKSPKSVTDRSKKSNSSSRTPKSKKSRKSSSTSRTPKSKKSVSPEFTPVRARPTLSPSGTPKATTKSKAMEASIKQKIKQMKSKDNEEKKITLKKDEKPKKNKKKPEKKSKLDKLYQELTGKS